MSAEQLADSDRLSAVWKEPAPLFVYGSLLFPEVMQILIGRDPDRTPAVVSGWSVVALPDKLYPGLIRGGEAKVSGHLITELTEREWRILDAFESDFYELHRVITQHHQDAWVYALNGSDLSSSDTWDADRFAQDSLQAYLSSCRRWSRSFGPGQ